MGQLVRFGVAMDEDLLGRFDGLVARRGTASNRSEAVRDLVRDALVDAEWEGSDEEIVGTVTMVFDHHASDLSEKLDSLQHEHFREIVAAMHVHLDAHNCLEVLVIRGVQRGGARHRRRAAGHEGRQARQARDHHERPAPVGTGVCARRAGTCTFPTGTWDRRRTRSSTRRSSPIWAVAAAKVRKTLKTKQIPLLALGAAFSFVIMMFNVPVLGGSTGHAVGGDAHRDPARALGGLPSSVSIALVIQALVFGDGGITAIGANCLNMAVILPFVGYYTYRLVAGRAPGYWRRVAAAGVGSYLGIVAAAIAAGFEFGIQPLIAHTASGQPLYAPYPSERRGPGHGARAPAVLRPDRGRRLRGRGRRARKAGLGPGGDEARIQAAHVAVGCAGPPDRAHADRRAGSGYGLGRVGRRRAQGHPRLRPDRPAADSAGFGRRRCPTTRRRSSGIP